MSWLGRRRSGGATGLPPASCWRCALCRSSTRSLRSSRACAGSFPIAEALPHYVRAVAILEDVQDGPEVQCLKVIALGALGNVHRALGRYAEAELLLRRALAKAEALGTEDPSVRDALNDLGVLSKYTGNFAEARRLDRRALRILVVAHP